MNKEELLRKTQSCEENIQQMLMVIERAKAKVSSERGKIEVYRELLQKIIADEEAAKDVEKPDDQPAGEDQE